MNDFGGLLGTPYAPVSKIAPVKREMQLLFLSLSRYTKLQLNKTELTRSKCE